jgi:hypothetical protein
VNNQAVSFSPARCAAAAWVISHRRLDFSLSMKGDWRVALYFHRAAAEH